MFFGVMARWNLINLSYSNINSVSPKHRIIFLENSILSHICFILQVHICEAKDIQIWSVNQYFYMESLLIVKRIGKPAFYRCFKPLDTVEKLFS